MVVVEARVHAAELGQAHRHVAVVEDHRNPEALAQEGRDPRKCAIGTVKTTTASTSRSASSTFVRCLPARRHPAPDRLARRLVEDRLVGRSSARRRYRSPFSRARARSGRRRLSPSTQVGFGAVRHHGDSTGRPPVGRHDQVGADLVEPLPELPPRGRAAVAVVEVDRGRDGEDLRRLHARQHRSGDEGAVKGLGRPR